MRFVKFKDLSFSSDDWARLLCLLSRSADVEREFLRKISSCHSLSFDDLEAVKYSRSLLNTFERLSDILRTGVEIYEEDLS